MIKRIAHITDLHFDEAFPTENGVDAHKNWATVLKDINNSNIDEVICTGDIGDEVSIAPFLKSLADAGFSPQITLGNHDNYAEVSTYHKVGDNQGSDALYYASEDAQYKRIFLDSSPDEVSQHQIDWLKKALQTELKILLFIHHPILDCGTILDQRFPLKNRAEINKVLKAGNKDILVFCGHYHMADERKEDHIHQHITPAISYQVGKLPDRIAIDNTTFGYRIIEISDELVSSKVIMFERKLKSVPLTTR
jgi:3',5'-cyclic AMP phosphodiesterase CpdA